MFLGSLCLNRSVFFFHHFCLEQKSQTCSVYVCVCRVFGQVCVPSGERTKVMGWIVVGGRWMHRVRELHRGDTHCLNSDASVSLSLSLTQSRGATAEIHSTSIVALTKDPITSLSTSSLNKIFPFKKIKTAQKCLQHSPCRRTNGPIFPKSNRSKLRRWQPENGEHNQVGKKRRFAFVRDGGVQAERTHKIKQTQKQRRTTRHLRSNKK